MCSGYQLTERKGATILQYCTFDIFLVKILYHIKLAIAPNLFYSICMMCDGYGLYGKFYMGPILVPYGSHMDVPRWAPDESLLQNPHQSHLGCPYKTNIITHLGPIWVLYSLLAGISLSVTSKETLAESSHGYL